MEKNKTYVFKLKQFSVRHEKSAMKIGVDSIILGSWTNIPEYGRILDVGTGCGILALMMAQRSNLEIDAIECDKESYNESIENFNNSHWKKRLFAYNCFFQDYAEKCNKKYTLIICNPPFFKNGTTPYELGRTIARHEKSLSINDLIYYSKKILDENGIISLIIPYERINDLLKINEDNKMFINRILYIKPTPYKNIHRVCIEISLYKHELYEEKILTIENGKRHHFTDEYINLTKDFYNIF